MRSVPSWGVVIGVLLLAGSAAAQARSGHRERSDVTRQFQNPLPDLMTLRFINDVDAGVSDGREAELLLRVVALLPMRLSPHVNLVLQTVVPVRSRPPPSPDTDRLNGLGNALQHALLGPTRAGPFLWAVGAVGDLPTATRSAFGTGHVAVGPSIILSYQTPAWTLGLNAWHLHSIAAPEGVRTVERTHFNPAVSYTLPSEVTLGVGTEGIYRWSAPAGERLTLPLMATLTRTTRVGRQNLNLTLAGRYFLARAPQSATWGLRLAVAFNFEIDREEADGDEG